MSEPTDMDWQWPEVTWDIDKPEYVQMKDGWHHVIISAPAKGFWTEEQPTTYEDNPMYEKFSNRSRKVMQLANQEAQRLSHEYIGTEHVLIGLIKEGSGVAAKALDNLGIDLRTVRLEVEKLMEKRESKPEEVILGKLPHTPRTKQLIEHAMQAARRLGHNYVGTEHLLLGMLCVEEGVACKILKECGASL